MAEVSTLSGRVSPRHRAPIRPITGRPSLAPPFLYPSAIPSLAVGIPPPRGDGTSGAYPVVQWREADGGWLRPLVRRVTVPPSPMSALDEPTRMPFWLRPVSTFGRLMITDLDNGRSLAFSRPSSARPPPDWCSQIMAVVPKLHTSDCSFACPGSSTWVDKVPSQGRVRRSHCCEIG